MEVWIEEILPQEKGIIGLRLYKWNQNWPDLFGNGWTTLKDGIFLILPGSFGSILCWLGTVWYLSWGGKDNIIGKGFHESVMTWARVLKVAWRLLFLCGDRSPSGMICLACIYIHMFLLQKMVYVHISINIYIYIDISILGRLAFCFIKETNPCTTR